MKPAATTGQPPLPAVTTASAPKTGTDSARKDSQPPSQRSPMGRIRSAVSSPATVPTGRKSGGKTRRSGNGAPYGAEPDPAVDAVGAGWSPLASSSVQRGPELR